MRAHDPSKPTWIEATIGIVKVPTDFLVRLYASAALRRPPKELVGKVVCQEFGNTYQLEFWVGPVQRKLRSVEPFSKGLSLDLKEIIESDLKLQDQLNQELQKHLPLTILFDKTQTDELKQIYFLCRPLTIEEKVSGLLKAEKETV